MIETEHRGVQIRYSENTDKWATLDMTLEAATLSALRAKINKRFADEAKAEAIPGIKIGGYSDFKYVTIGARVADRKSYKGTMVPRFRVIHAEPETRKWELVEAHELAPDTPQVRAVIEEVLVLRKQIEGLAMQAQKMLAAIPRIDAEKFRILGEEA